MSRAMCGNLLVNAALFHHWLQLLADTPIVHLTKYRLGIFLWIVTVAFDNLQGHCQQFHLIWYTCLMTFADNPFLTIHLYNVVRSQFLQVHKREGGEMNTKRSRTNARLASSNSCAITFLSSSSVRKVRSLHLGLI